MTRQSKISEALAIAVQMEQEGQAFCAGAAEKIALEENEHSRILDDTLLYLTDPAQWQIKEEKPLIDGG